jgi:hypothetical protein
VALGLTPNTLLQLSLPIDHMQALLSPACLKALTAGKLIVENAVALDHVVLSALIAKSWDAVLMSPQHAATMVPS